MKKSMYIILGATGGIGYAIYEKLQKEKPEEYYVLLVRTISHKEQFVNCKIIQMDFDALLDMSQLFSYLQEKMNAVEEIHLIIASGIIEPIDKIGTHKTGEITRNINVNAVGPSICIENVLGIVKQYNKCLKVIHLDSGASNYPIDGWGLYCSAKAYMSMFLRVLEVEGNCKVVNFDPGVVDTKMQQVIRSSKKEQCSLVDTFISYEEEGFLNTPSYVANQIYERYLEKWTAKELQEKIW